MGINRTLLIIAFLLLCKVSVCQEFLTPLKYNLLPAKHGSSQLTISTRSGVTDTASLPFWDDFSYNSRYPSNKLWMDSEVYINDGYGVNPPTIGVATFDGLNKFGINYDSIPFAWGGADTLTSRPFNFRNYSPADSIYLSFFYQPQGNGDVPLTYDSLILEFSDTLGQWDEVWSSGDSSLPDDSLKSFDSLYHVDFKQVLIPVKDLKYFSPGFQFRFRNFAIQSGNNNNWNIDYVKMSTNRGFSDTVLHDEAFQYSSQSILKNYTQMPWNQFSNYQSTELRQYYSFVIQNNFPNSNNTAVTYAVDDLNTDNQIYQLPIHSAILVNAESNYLDSLPIIGNFDSVPKSVAFLNTLHNVRDSFAEIDVKTYYNGINGDEYSQNDTVHHIQYFYNYYAYDNGTPETAYSLLGNGEAPELAYQFSVNRPDTIRAVQIYFVFANADDSNDIFDIQTWSSLTPETITYSDSEYYSHVLFGDSLTGNGFHTYILRHPVPVSGTFYVGFLQTELNPIYIGYDVNDNDSDKLYYNVGSGFQQSEFHGAVMIRPVLGDSIPPLPSAVAPPPVIKVGSLKVYPNPVKNLLTVKIQNTTIATPYISVENILGQTVINRSPLQDSGNIDVSSLLAGMYFLHLTDNKGNHALSAKFVKIN